MKYFIYLLIALASGLIIYNSTILDFEAMLDGDSKTALFSIIASGCVIILLLILLVSRRISEKLR